MSGPRSEGHGTTGGSRDGVVLAVDAGTGSCRAIVFDLDGNSVGEGSREWKHATDDGAPGSQVFDAAGGWGLVAGCIREALAALPDPGAVLAVAACGMGGGMVLYDGTGTEVWACANGDARAEREANELLESGDAERLYRVGGGWLSLDAPPRLRWVRRHAPDVFGAVRRMTMIGDWVTYRLSGAFAVDPSMGSTSGMFDLATRDWSPLALDLCGLDPARVPEVVDGGTPIGRVTTEAAEATGLAPGTTVVAGGADTALALVGAGHGLPGALSVTGGSFWKQSVVIDRPLVDVAGRLRTTCHALPGEWLAEGIAFYAGLALRWLRDRQPLDRRRAQADPYVWLEEQAAHAPPGACGVRAATAPTDAWRWSDAPEDFLDAEGVVVAAARPGLGARAIEEAAAFTSRWYVEAIEDLVGARFDQATMTGGAARGALWPHIVADVLGVRVHVPAAAESAARGAAALACIGAGVYGSPADVPRPDEEAARVVEPDPPAVAVYDELYRRWAELLTPAPLREAR